MGNLVLKCASAPREESTSGKPADEKPKARSYAAAGGSGADVDNNDATPLPAVARRRLFTASSDGEAPALLAMTSVGAGAFCVGSEYGHISMLRAGSLCETKPHANEVTALRFDPASSNVYAASRDRKISVARVHDEGMEHQTFMEGHRLGVTAIDVHESGAWLVSGSRDNTVRLWDAQTCQCVSEADIKLNIVHCVRWLPALSLVAQGGEDLAIRLWDVRTAPGRQHGALVLVDTLVGFDYHPICADIVHDGVGHTLAVGHNGFNDNGSTVSFWDLRALRVLRHCAGHSNTVRRIVGAADGVVVTGSDDNTLRVWAGAGATASTATSSQATTRVESRIAALCLEQPVDNRGSQPHGVCVVAAFRDGEVSAWTFRDKALKRTTVFA